MSFLSVEEVFQIIEETPALEGPEEICVQEAAGHIAAEDCRAKNAQPPFDRSPLDGFAFRSEDVQGACRERPARLQQVGYVPAGCGETFSVGPGQCVRIMTGGPIPADCDAVIGIEDAAYEDTSECDGDAAVLIFQEISHHQNYVFAGEDFAKGQVLCRSGMKIDAALAACLACGGYEKVFVQRRPEIAVLSTGSEIVPSGVPLKSGKIYDSNSVYLKNRLAQLGFDAEVQTLPDDADAIAKALREKAGSYDLILTTGGVSVGDADHMLQVLKMLGAVIRFQGCGMKPGSPVMLGQLGQAQILCLSGNPYAAAATFELFGRSLLARLAGDAQLAMKKTAAVLTEDFIKGSPVPRFVRSKMQGGLLEVPDTHSSGQLYSFAGCNCLAKIPAGSGPVKAGTELDVYLI